MNRNILWSPLDEPGLEHLSLVQRDDGITADGMILRVMENTLLRVHYTIRCDVEWRVREVNVRIMNEDRREIILCADGEGHWTDGSGNSIPSLDGALETDISITPFTNTLAIRRMKLAPGESSEITVAYIELPEMRVTPSRQRYTCLELGQDGGLYRYEDLGVANGFTAELPVDADGLVIDYPGLFKRV